VEKSQEINFDGIVGPSHNYGGLSFGNVASMHHKHFISNPKKAALQGLHKMRQLTELGLQQGVLPPQERPYLPFLHAVGFQGKKEFVIQQAWKEAPELLINCSSAASMWTANAATISPSADTADQKVHFTPANLISKLHRSFESETTTLVLRKIFSDPTYFIYHPPLPANADLADEVAANHTRFCRHYHEKGIELFVFGRHVFKKDAKQPLRFPARQTFEASQAIARLHGLSSEHIIWAQQNPDAIDQGVFHNDVISVGNQHVFFYHQQAFVDTSFVVRQIQEKVENLCQSPFFGIEVPSEAIPLEEAVKTYLFNSQLVTLPDGHMALIAPQECQDSETVRFYLSSLIQKQTPIKQVLYLNLRESMHNGGGPACLRLRVVLNEKERASCHPFIFLTDELHKALQYWIERHYREQLAPHDLADPLLLEETYVALDELTQLLKLGSIYSFQH
jgi:succinylarginine dihydrolase